MATLKHDHPSSFDFIRRIREIDMFFQGNDGVHQTMDRVAEKLQTAGIDHAIAGGMAVNSHRHERTTKDVDFLVTQDGLARFMKLHVGSDFERVPGRPRRFRDPATGVTFNFLVTGLFPESGKPGPIAYPDPAQVRELIQDRHVLNLPTLIQLKLAARRHQDFADVVNLIAVHDLDESYVKLLHPAVHRDYIECLEEKRREDEYERRQDEAFEEILPGDETNEES